MPVKILSEYRKYIGVIASRPADINPAIPTTLLAFFPSYQLLDHRPPTYNEMLASYQVMKDQGLENMRLGNIGVFAKTEEQIRTIRALKLG